MLRTVLICDLCGKEEASAHGMRNYAEMEDIAILTGWATKFINGQTIHIGPACFANAKIEPAIAPAPSNGEK